MSEDRRLSITSSSPLAPDDVARHTFATVRKGFDPSEVRDYLESIAAGLRTLSEREQELRARLADAEHRAANPVIDDSMLTDAVGKETAKVLRSAHEAAAEKVANAEAEAARMVAESTEASGKLMAEATEVAAQAQSRADALAAERTAEAEAEADAMKAQTTAEAERLRQHAQAEATALVERARQEGRSMVEEAQELRARVLADLGRRRKALHIQLEQLQAGRQRMAEALHEVRTSIESISGDLDSAEDRARQAAQEAAHEAAERDAGMSADDGDDGIDGGESAVPQSEVDALFAKLRAARTPDGEAAEAPQSDTDSEGSAGSGTGSGTEPAAAAPSASAPAVPKAKSRSSKRTASKEVVTEATGDSGETPESEGPPENSDPRVARRDVAIAPLVTALARRLKRNLQDAQNELLDQLRTKGTTWSTDLLPPEVEQVDAVSTSALPHLIDAAQAGADFAEGTGTLPDDDTLAGVGHTLAVSVVGPLRKRLSASGGVDPEDEAAVQEHVGSAFREWKGERIEGLAADAVITAFSMGTVAASASDGPRLRWVAVAAPDEAPCPDCEDNGLHDAQAAGEEFSTGHAHPPAHPGCRCVLAPAAP